MINPDGASAPRHGKMKSDRRIFRLFAMAWLTASFVLILWVAAGCQGSPGLSTPTPHSTQTPTATLTVTPVTPDEEPPGEAGAQPNQEQVLSTPTLAPTATPSQLDETIEQLSQRVGIDDLVIFGLNAKNLVNLLISLLIALGGGLLGVLVVNGLLWLVEHLASESAKRLGRSVKNQLIWLIALIFLQFATSRLAFLPPSWKQWLNLVYFSLFVAVIASLVWKLIDFGLEGPLIRASSPQDRHLLVAFTPLLRRTIQILIYAVALGIILSNWGVNLSALLAVLGLGGLAVSLAAKQTLEDFISGFILLIDRPFQIGDRVKIENVDTWGDVENIGARTTRVRTLDNRLVIVPNSIVAQSQIETYSVQDPSYRIKILLGIGYDSDIDQVILIIHRAIVSVAGMRENKPPMIDLVEFGDSAMIFRVIYWLASYMDLSLRTEVNKAIFQALAEANVEMPFTTYDINLVHKEPPPGGSSESPG